MKLLLAPGAYLESSGWRFNGRMYVLPRFERKRLVDDNYRVHRLVTGEIFVIGSSQAWLGGRVLQAVDHAPNRVVFQ